MKVQVISYEHLFGDNDYNTSHYEQYTVVKNGIKYLPLDIVLQIGFHYETYAIREVEV